MCYIFSFVVVCCFVVFVIGCSELVNMVLNDMLVDSLSG